MHQLGSALADDVYPEQFLGFDREQHFQHALAQAHDLPARGFAKTRDADLVGDMALVAFLLGQPDHADFGHRVNAVGKEFRLARDVRAESVAGRMPALLHRGRGQARKTDDITGGIDMRLYRLVILVDRDSATLVCLDADFFERQVIGHALASRGKQHRIDGHALAALELDHYLAVVELVNGADLIAQPHLDIAVTQVMY